MPSRLGLAALLVVAAAGCATEDGYEKVVNSYMGSPEDSLLAHWGPPDQVYTSSSDAKYLTYLYARSGQVAGVPPIYQTSCSFGTCTTTPVGGSPGYSFTKTCKTSFKVVRGVIASWSFEGNACRA